jgi:hypothetical protein
LTLSAASACAAPTPDAARSAVHFCAPVVARCTSTCPAHHGVRAAHVPSSARPQPRVSYRGRRAPRAPAIAPPLPPRTVPPPLKGQFGGIWTFVTRQLEGVPPRGRLPWVTPPSRHRRRPRCRAGAVELGPARRELPRAVLPVSAAAPLWQF